MRLLLVRHGQSEWNAARLLQGQADIALSAQGVAEARALRPTIERLAPTRSVSSDLARVRDTAAAIGAPQVRFTGELREIDVGDWTGRSIEMLEREERESWLGWRAGTATPPGGESWQVFADRVSAAVERECVERPCESLLVVCHGGVIRALLQRLLALAPASVVPVAPASLSVVRVSPEGERPARLELFNYRPGELELAAPD